MCCGQMPATIQQRSLQFLVHGPCRAHDAARHPCNAPSLQRLIPAYACPPVPQDGQEAGSDEEEEEDALVHEDLGPEAPR